MKVYGEISNVCAVGVPELFEFRNFTEINKPRCVFIGFLDALQCGDVPALGEGAWFHGFVWFSLRRKIVWSASWSSAKASVGMSRK